jgi:NTP pyrophosphatase (non-canonical NTP hydrolase)
VIETFEEYQKEAVRLRMSTRRFRERNPEINEEVIKIVALSYDGLGLGESGEVQGKIKKIIRDSGGVITSEATNEIKKELGDVLWYIASMCDNLGITLKDVATGNIEKLQDRNKRNVLEGSGDNR